MKTILALCVAFVLAQSVFAEDKTVDSKVADANAADVKAQRGVWKPIEGTLGGIGLPPAGLTNITLKLDGDKYEVIVKGEKRADKGTCKLDTTTTPRRMNITSAEGVNNGKTFPAIYEMKDANTMRICYDLSGKNYPTEFKADEGTQLYLVTYKRQEK